MVSHLNTKRWLATDLSQYAKSADFVYDVVIVGSGYGGSIAAAELADKEVKVCVLERGQEYLPGAFPSTLGELPAHVQIHRNGEAATGGNTEGLFDLRMGPDVSALIASGLGGGSLINGAVMVKPKFDHFSSRWPAQLVADLKSNYLDGAAALLGSGNTNAGANTIQKHADNPKGGLPKWRALGEIKHKGDKLSDTPITIQMKGQPSISTEVKLEACTLCGDCLTGCNVGARASLDTNLLVKAMRDGVEIYTGASVLKLLRDPDKKNWVLEVVHTKQGVQQQRDIPLQIKAKKVILAAGTFGSTEILLKSQSDTLVFSSKLGEQFSANGDNVVAFETDNDTQSGAQEHQPLGSAQLGRGVGPEITRVLEVPADNSGPSFMVQEFSIPAPLRKFYRELVSTRDALEQITKADWNCHGSLKGKPDPIAVNDGLMNKKLLVGLIGHDASIGTLALPRGAKGAVGQIQVKWAGAASDLAMKDAYQKLSQRIQAKYGKKTTITPNPLWQLAPDTLGFLTNDAAGSVFTVHPLGGCPIGEDGKTGVVNEWGQVFNLGNPPQGQQQDDWQGSLVVLDGSMIPSSLGANPSLTIAAISLRAIKTLCSAKHWNFAAKSPALAAPVNTLARPTLRDAASCTPAQQAQATKLQIIERLWGVIPNLSTPDGSQNMVLELTFGFETQSVEALTEPGQKVIPLDKSPALLEEFPRINTLRLFRESDWTANRVDLLGDMQRDPYAVAVAKLDGSLVMLEQQFSWVGGRFFRGWVAFLRNRGFRDIFKYFRARLGGSATAESFGPVVQQIAKQTTKAAEIRTFEYQAQVIETIPTIATQLVKSMPDWDHILKKGFKIHGRKRLTYALGENVWNQLLYLDVLTFGRTDLLSHFGCGAPKLKVDTRFAAKQGVPLVRITQQQDQVYALADMASFGLYWVRLLAKLHLWSFRQPDPSSVTRPNRLPRELKGLPVPQITEIDLEPQLRGTKDAVRVRLTRYASAGSKEPALPPLVMIHGYSASGTTFSHPSLKPSMAEYFWKLGRDVWILDLRTSCGMPTAQMPWAFEDAAWADIPVAIDYISKTVAKERASTARIQVDVVAHCIGAVMLSMALLTDTAALAKDPRNHRVASAPTRYQPELNALLGNIHKMVLSQKGFMLEYTDANVIRAYGLGFFRSLLKEGYSFRPSPYPKMGVAVLDALLTSMPYPDHEWEAAHPWVCEVPWEATRHRMDAFYERTFELRNMPEAVLGNIDDFFGPLNVETLAQVLDFARYHTITTRGGWNDFVSVELLKQKWPKEGTLMLGGADNGMVDARQSGVLMSRLLTAAGITKHKTHVVAGAGHQDLLLGLPAQEVFGVIDQFLK